MTRHNNGTAAATGIVLVGVAIALTWLAIAPQIFGSGDTILSGPLPGTEEASPTAAALIEGMRITQSFQVSQPRDPFRPLITEDSPIGGGGGFTPAGITVTLLEIRDVDGVQRATIQVNGITYDVSEGDTFAGNFMVVSLDVDCGVFLFGDNAFELCVGETILK
ncbi:MAG: hypothetical protein ACE5MI_01605 [Acidimicrobiia bacterium]